jgi:hypothetical protein
MVGDYLIGSGDFWTIELTLALEEVVRLLKLLLGRLGRVLTPD